MEEAAKYRMQPVPSFAAGIRRLVAEATRLAAPPPVLAPPDDAEKAVLRVLELHTRCGCTVCAAGHTRAVCNGCQDFWPCKTVHAARGTSVRLAD